MTEELSKIENYLAQRDVLAPEVSAVDVAWHLDHMLKVILAIGKNLQASDPAGYRTSFNALRLIVFTTGRFPRGKATAPKSVRPPENIHTEDVVAQLAEVRTLLPLLQQLSPRHYSDHPYFGQLNRRRSVRFLRIHTRHHLRIIEDILKAARS